MGGVPEGQDALEPLGEPLIALLLENRTAFLRFLARKLGNEAQAEDLLQSSLLKAIRSTAEIRDPEAVVPWFYRVLKHALIDLSRRHQAEDRKTEGFQSYLESVGETSHRPMAETEAEICACFEALLPTLKAEYRDVLRKVDLEGLKPAQIAKETGLSANVISVRLHRARTALRTSLERVCGMCSTHGCLNCQCSTEESTS